MTNNSSTSLSDLAISYKITLILLFLLFKKNNKCLPSELTNNK